MTEWRPRPTPTFDHTAARLSPNERFVLARIDGRLAVDEIAAFLVIPEDDLRGILRSLAAVGAIDGDPADGATSAETDPPRDDGMPDDATADDATADDAMPDDATDDAADDATPIPENVALAYRRTFETELRQLDVAVRLEMARTGDDAQKRALAFDHDAAVVRALVTRGGGPATLDVARLVARHHVHAPNLELLANAAPLARDPQVARHLLRNAHTSEAAVKRLLGARRLADLYKSTLDSELPDRTRQIARALLRAKFATATPDERTALLVTTEARVLAALVGLTLDGRTTSMLCARAYGSTIFVQNLARWSATPPVLLAHLLKQPLVRRQPQLRQMILQHANTPGEVKRKL